MGDGGTDERGAIRALLDKQAIHEALMRYCRGVDRLDPDLVNSAFHADATDQHGVFQYTGTTVGPEIVARLAPLRASLHLIGNELVQLHGESADVESYFTMWLVSDDGANEVVRHGFGRYVDHFESRDGDWRISHRIVLVEWANTVTGQRDEELARLLGPIIATRTRDDPSYRYLSHSR
jgi:hypothetical protein